MDGEWYTPEEAQDILGVSHRGLRKLLCRGRLVGSRIPSDKYRRWEKVSVESVQAYLDSRDKKRREPKRKQRRPGRCRLCHLVTEQLEDELCEMCRWELAHPGRHRYYELETQPSCWMHEAKWGG